MRVNASDGTKITLDGEAVENFISADTDDGWVRVSDELVRRGKVEIVGGKAGEHSSRKR